jgi:hypothetical protein
VTNDPYVGQWVHYVSYGTPGGKYPSTCRAAIVTELPPYLEAEPMDGCPNGTGGEWVVSLTVLNPKGWFCDENVPLSEEKRLGGTWHPIGTFDCGPVGTS